MTLLETIESKQAEINQQYSEYEKQRDNANAEMLRLQGDHRAYEYIKEQLAKEQDNASDQQDANEHSGVSKHRKRSTAQTTDGFIQGTGLRTRKEH